MAVQQEKVAAARLPGERHEEKISWLRRLMGRSFYQRVIALIKGIPPGKVATYGQIATYAGNPRAARQVAYILHSSSRKENLPWHRVINSKGAISLKPKHGYELQKELLEKEEIIFDENDCVDLTRFGVRS